MPKKNSSKPIGTSPWAPNFRGKTGTGKKALYRRFNQGFEFEVRRLSTGLWVIVTWPSGSRIAFRSAFCPQGECVVSGFQEKNEMIEFQMDSAVGSQIVTLTFPKSDQALMRYTTTLRCNVPTVIPFWPRDIVPLANTGRPLLAQGEIHVVQKGARSGLLFASLPECSGGGSFLYFQNLTALSGYCEATQTTVADAVGGQWPELGFALPTTTDQPLPTGSNFVISDAIVAFHPDTTQREMDVAKQYLESLAEVYVHLDLPETKYPDWTEITKKSLNDLENCPGCWAHVNGRDYLNAYVSDYASPPESMVQLAVLVPLLEYSKWLGRDLPIIKRIEEGLPNFFDPKIGCIARWLPEKEAELSGEEEHKKPRVMDSWYQLHTLLNLSRMALHGNKTAKKLFLDSLDFAIKVARHFKYHWPVFYNVDTLEIIKAETKPGEGGQKDVPGSYAHVMLQAWELTKERRFLAEAKKAAKALQGSGLKLLYQANNTAFASGAMLRLWKETHDEVYLNLSYLCLANLFKNVWLWDAQYGFGKAHSNFFALFPLDDAPYTAVYEEQEVFSALSNYIVLAEGEPILPSVRLLIAEFIRYAGYRGVFYYPPLLPREVLAEKSKTGDLDRDLWIPIEDMHDGWEKSGEVGQEVYGAGQAFGFLVRHFLQIPEQEFIVYVDYPITRRTLKADFLSFQVGGDSRLSCRVRLIPTPGSKLPRVSLTAEKRMVEGKLTKEGHFEYLIKGNQAIKLQWTKHAPK